MAEALVYCCNHPQPSFSWWRALARPAWLLHSTLAAVLLVAQLVQDGSVSLETGLYLVLGAYLGGAMPALVAGWSMKPLRRRIVLSNLLYRVCALLLGALAITFLSSDWAPAVALGGFAIILAHSGLNLVNGLLLLSALPWITPCFKPDDIARKPSMPQAHIDQLGGHHRENLVSTQIFMDVLRDLQRICSHLTTVSYPLLKRKQLLEAIEQSGQASWKIRNAP